MKKLLIIIALTLPLAGFVSAQKIAYIDMAYILKNLPQYETANEQLAIVSKRWQKEIEQAQQEAQQLTSNYQTEQIFLSEDLKAKREDEILQKEKEAMELKRKYFGADGELFKKRESLITPIHEEISTAVQDIAKLRGYQIVYDRASAGIIYGSPQIDISNEVLQKLGYGN